MLCTTSNIQLHTIVILKQIEIGKGYKLINNVCLDSVLLNSFWFTFRINGQNTNGVFNLQYNKQLLQILV